jgi:ABC-type bacteriocin/lantibiotic exporter with double-glycine peptidase domain
MAPLGARRPWVAAERTLAKRSKRWVTSSHARHFQQVSLSALLGVLGCFPLPLWSQDSVPIVSQTSASNCGIAALTMLLRSKAGVVTSVGSLDALAATLIDPTSRTHRSRGYSVGELQMLSRAYGHSLIARKVTLTDLFNLSFPVIAWVDTGNGGHFTVVEGLADDQILMADPTRGHVRLSRAAWTSVWLKGQVGIVLTLAS